MKARTGVTLVELLLVIAFLGVGVAVSQYAGPKYGVFGYVVGFIAGTVGSCGLFFAFGIIVAYIFEIFTGIPEYPVCANGKCRVRKVPDSDYRYEWTDDRLVARCKCDTPYVKKGRRFLLLQADGSLTPYMIWKPLRGWFADETGA